MDCHPSRVGRSCRREVGLIACPLEEVINSLVPHARGRRALSKRLKPTPEPPSVPRGAATSSPSPVATCPWPFPDSLPPPRHRHPRHCRHRQPDHGRRRQVDGALPLMESAWQRMLLPSSCVLPGLVSQSCPLLLLSCLSSLSILSSFMINNLCCCHSWQLLTVRPEFEPQACRVST